MNISVNVAEELSERQKLIIHEIQNVAQNVAVMSHKDMLYTANQIHLYLVISNLNTIFASNETE